MAGEASEGMLFDFGFGDGVTSVLAVPERGVAMESERVDRAFAASDFKAAG